MARTVHVIGAGLAGLSAAVRLAEAGEMIVVHEANAQAGGRCRSYFDHTLGITIDNGNHLLLSGNRAALAFLRTVGGEAYMIGPEHARFPFVDLASGERWTIEIGDGRAPWWIFDVNRRVPGARLHEYLRFLRLLLASRDNRIGDILNCSGMLFERLIRPLLLAALNVEPSEGSAGLAAAVLRETLLRGGRACRPLIARDGLTCAFIDPALNFLKAKRARIELGRELRRIVVDDRRIETLQFADGDIALHDDDLVILAVPPWSAGLLLPRLTVPTAFRAILNAHFRIAPDRAVPPLISLINATTEWIFAFPDRLSVTISGADRLMTLPREALAQTIWREVAAVTKMPPELPPWQIVRERRATFAAVPEEDKKRPGATTVWSNLVLAGDWTDTGLPATIEGAIRSGERAAAVVLRKPVQER